ncbi:hypothetical protein ACFLWZ_03355 [Chloroflexota bacterium]
MAITRTRIRERRAKRDPAQDTPAEIAAVTRQTALRLEQGKYNPALLPAHRPAKSLSSTIHEFFPTQTYRPALNRVLATQSVTMMPSHIREFLKPNLMGVCYVN